MAAGRLGSIPLWRKRSITSVAVEPTGSNVARTGTRVSIEPMWWWSRISTISACSTPTTLCACSAWSTSSTCRAGGFTRSERVTSPIGRRVAVDGDGRAVVHVLDEVRDLGHEVLRPDGQRRLVHQRARRLGERDHPPGHVGVERRDHHGGTRARARARGSRRPAACGCSARAARPASRWRPAARPADRRRRRCRPRRRRSAWSPRSWPARTRGRSAPAPAAPSTSSPSSTRTIAPSAVGASSRDASRDSRM